MTPTTEHDELADAPFHLGEWLVEPRLNRLTRGEESTQIELKMMDVLVCLAGRAGELVTRQEIIDTVWSVEYITEKTLTRAVAELRRTLGDDAKEPTYIETIHRKGYRLIRPVEVEPEASATIARFPARAPQDGRDPYPGLAAFTEDDAELFFGREAEVARLWRTITARRLLAVIGPSGVGKTSFLRAGLIPAAPEGWGVLICAPGEAPFAALARALVPEFADDHETISRLVGIREPSEMVAMVGRWRERHDRALLIIDQFEELFTLNPQQVQAVFGTLIGLLARDADVHVLLSLRDDFLYRCHDHETLLPVFSELSPLKAPGRDDLRRALVEPAARHGCSFEDDALVDEMLDEVAGERGALPLLAFAVARLWEKRDRERRLLTRQAYSKIGGVAGALAHHAEASIERIGTDRLPVVRELFRNLVTAEGTRAAREWNELLSIFSDSQSESQPEEVLRQLIDARLLTSYEIREGDEAPTRRVEIIHESLLANWPRLVRWQTQDADSARLHDELRQAARIWREHGRPDDLLWTGSAYREYTVWRERYPGGLSELEESFAKAMTSHATRRRRRRRIAAAAVTGILAVIAIVLGTLWRRSVVQELRAEAANLVALGQLQLEGHPTSALAHAIASLELADAVNSRHLAQEALWRGPTAFVVNDERTWQVRFTPDGSSLVQGGDANGVLRLIRSDGRNTVLNHQHTANFISVHMGSDVGVFGTSGFFDKNRLPWVGLWSANDARLLGNTGYEDAARLASWAVDSGRQRFVYMVVEGERGDIEGRAFVDSLRFDGRIERLGVPQVGISKRADWFGRVALDPRAGRFLVAVTGSDVIVVDIGQHELGESRRLGSHGGSVESVAIDSAGNFVAVLEADGDIRIWAISGDTPPRGFRATDLIGPGFLPRESGLQFPEEEGLLILRTAHKGLLTAAAVSLESDPPRLLRTIDLGISGRGTARYDHVADAFVKAGPDLDIRLWPMRAPADSEPLSLRRGGVETLWDYSVHPDGQWLASADYTGLALWPLSRSYPAVIRRHRKKVTDLQFDPDGAWLASSSMDDTTRLWPLEGSVPPAGRVVFEDPGVQMWRLRVAPDGRSFLLGTSWSGVRLFSLSGQESETVPDIGPVAIVATISPDGRFGAAVEGWGAEPTIHVWEFESGEVLRTLRAPGRHYGGIEFTADGDLLTSCELGLRRWDLERGDSELLLSGYMRAFSVSDDGTELVVIEVLDGTETEGKSGESGGRRRLLYLNLETGESRPLPGHGVTTTAVEVDFQKDLVVTGDRDGVVRVGRLSWEEPFLLFGHEALVLALAFDPLGRWIASGGDDSTIRLWPMPDLSKPPLHTLPREELIAKLKTLTNLRVVRDETSSTGWKIEVGPFPGWETVPSW